MRLGPVVEATIASRDPARQIRFLREAFQLELLDEGPTGTVVGVPGIETGRVRVVPAASDPEVPEPLGYELGPRLLAMRTRDVARSRELFEAAGGRAGPTVTYDHPETQNDEFVGRGPDDVLWAVAYAVGGRPSPALERDRDRLATELFSCVVNVESVDAERRLFDEIGWQAVLDLTMDGRAIEEVLELPHGTTLKFFMGADRDNSPSRIELMEFAGVPAVHHHERAVGIRRVTIAVAEDDLETAGAALERGGASPSGPGVYVGPAGLELELRPS